MFALFYFQTTNFRRPPLVFERDGKSAWAWIHVDFCRRADKSLVQYGICQCL